MHLHAEKQRRTPRIGGRSHGPITKKADRLARHTRLAKIVVWECESTKDFLALAETLEGKYNPVTSTQIHLVEMMTVCRWRILGLQRMKASLMDRAVSFDDPQAGPVVVLVAKQDSPEWKTLHRREKMYERRFGRTLKCLLEYQAYLRNAATSSDAA
jgi:hypothetical protein